MIILPSHFLGSFPPRMRPSDSHRAGLLAPNSVHPRDPAPLRNPSPLRAGRPVAIPLVVGDDLQGGASRGSPPDVKLRLQVEKLADRRGLAVTINGDALRGASLTQGWLEYDVPPPSVKTGENRIEVTPRAARAEAPVLTDLELRIHYPAEE